MGSQSLDDGEFWLPPKFLVDDDGFVGRKAGFVSCKGEPADGSFPFEFSQGFGAFGGVASNLSSPVESVMCSSETESEEEDYIAGLTRQMAHSALKDGLVSDALKARFAMGSPQSPLRAEDSSCGCHQVSGGGSPNGRSPVSLPPTTLDLLFAAAEVGRMRMNDGDYLLNRSKGLLVPPRKLSPVSVPMKESKTSIEYYYQQLQAAQFQHLRQQQMMKQQSSAIWGNQKKTAEQYQRHLNQSQMLRSNGWNCENDGSRNYHPMGSSPTAWPLQEQKNHQHGSGMRAVFLENHGGKRECVGTGVFLPRQSGNHSVTRKKPGCSPVLVPAKVIQALNLNLNDIQVQSPVSRFVSDSDATQRFRSNSAHYHQKRNLQVQPMVNHELRLPNEWTY